MNEPYGANMPMPFMPTVSKAEEVEKLVEISKKLNIEITKDEFLYLCNLVFGKIPDPYMNSLVQLALSHTSATFETKEEPKKDKAKDD